MLTLKDMITCKKHVIIQLIVKGIKLSSSKAINTMIQKVNLRN